ncbi:MAG: ABC transporter permease [Sphaerobacteraceae bacterium]|nr:MAG: ABC transporter permease [Sphaerobacteraceae bacterium]
MSDQALKRPISQPRDRQPDLTSTWRVSWVISDTIVMTKRNLMKYIRLPQLLVFSTIQPVMFVLLFAFVFGGAIDTPGVDYINFLIPGILIQSVVFGSSQTSVGLADDLNKGMIDRYRSLPMTRGAVMAGRTLADSIRNTFVVFLMLGVGTAIGFRYQDGLLKALAAVALVVLFGYAFSWIAAFIGLLTRNPEIAGVAGFIWVFPLVFASSVFVPVETMPSWLQAFAEVQPISATADTVRALMLGTPVEKLWYMLAWMAAILAVFIPLSVWKYRRLT